jgi:actin-related protein
MTEPYMNLNFIRETMDQIFFEEYEVASFARYDRKMIFLSTNNLVLSSGDIKCISI